MNWIYEYYAAIKSGDVIVGKWIQILYKYIVDGLENGLFVYSAKKANKAIKFIETFCHHCEGDLAPNLIKLELWQKAVIACMFGLVDEDGYRHFREVVLIMGRKNGKTLFASAIIAYCTYMDGEYGAKTFCVAPKLDQADLVFSAYWQTVLAEPELADITRKRTSDIYVALTNSTVKKIAFNAKKSDGFNPSLVVADEIASWQGDAGLKQYEVMKSALGSRKQPIVLSISTSGFINDGIYDELIKRSTRFLLGESKESRLLPFLYMIDDVEKWNDINELRKSNPNLGVSISVDYLLEEIAIADGSLSKKSEFLTKYCNIKQNSSQAFISAQDVAKASGAPLSLGDFAGSYCVGGIDLSMSVDLTSACVIIERDGELYVFSKFWLPEEKIDEASARDGLPYRMYIQRGLMAVSGENCVDYNDCKNWFVELVSKYKILPLQVGYDRYSANYLVQDMQAYGFHMDSVNQGWNLTPVIHELSGILKDGTLHIGDNDLLKVHMLNTALKVDAEYDRCKIVKMSANEHIDGTAALIDALTVRQKWYGEIGGRLQNRGGKNGVA